MSKPGAGAGEWLGSENLVASPSLPADSCSQGLSAFFRCSHLLPLSSSSLALEGSGDLGDASAPDRAPVQQ